MPSILDRAGGLIFRARSFLPLPLIYLVVGNAWDSHIAPGPGGHDVDDALNIVGLALCVLGASIRFMTIGLIPAGTSSQSRTMAAPSLTTTGPYSVVRHPLYVGNFFITLGLLCIAHEPWAYGVGLAYWAISHLLIARAEEKMLREKYGAEFETWAREVPAWVPRVSRWKSSNVPFAWKRTIQREVNPLVAWTIGATILFLWERFVRRALPGPMGMKLLGLIIALLLVLLANKIWKVLGRRRAR